MSDPEPALTADDLHSAGLQRGGRCIRPGQPDHIVAPLEQPAHERRADHAGPAGDEYAGHAD